MLHVDYINIFDAFSQTKNADDEKEEDLIVLRGGGLVTKWRFPYNSKDCPIRNCGLEFELRSHAIVHYKIYHAMNYFYCSMCDGPIPTYKLKNYKEHYRSIHPTVEIPSDVEKQTDIVRILNQNSHKSSQQQKNSF